MNSSYTRLSLFSLGAILLSSCNVSNSNSIIDDQCGGEISAQEVQTIKETRLLDNLGSKNLRLNNSENPLKVGMDLSYPPFETADLDNNPEGISVDVAKGLGTYLNRDTTIVNTGFAGLIPSLQADEIDIIIASMSITAARQQIVDFSNPYFYFKIITLVNRDFCLANDLTPDTTTEELLSIEGTRYAGITGQVSASIPLQNNKQVTEYATLATAVLSVVEGDNDVLLMSASPVVNALKANRNKTMVVWDPWVASPIGMAVKKGNTALLASANAFIDTFNDEDGMYDQLRANWDAVILAQLERYGLDFYINEN
jgi:polar amino acid transport system substrate-binding protein